MDWIMAASLAVGVTIVLKGIHSHGFNKGRAKGQAEGISGAYATARMLGEVYAKNKADSCQPAQHQEQPNQGDQPPPDYVQDEQQESQSSQRGDPW